MSLLLVGVQYKVPWQTKQEWSVLGMFMLLTEWVCHHDLSSLFPIDIYDGSSGWHYVCLAKYCIENEKMFNISYMPWEFFNAVLVSPRLSPKNQERWALIHSWDCIIGRIDYMINTIYTTYKCSLHPITDGSCRLPNSHYTLRMAEQDQYKQIVSVLA